MPAWVRFVLVTFFAVAVLGGFNVYLYRRLIRDVTDKTSIRRGSVLAMLIAAMLTVLARVLAMALPGIGGRVVFVAILSFWGFALYATLALLVLEPLQQWWRRRHTGSVDPAKRALLTRGAAGLSALAAASVSGFGVYRAFREPEVTAVPVKLPGLPRELDGLTLVQLSDIHVGALIQERFVGALVDIVNAQKPDAVLITGDLVDGRVDAISRYVAGFQKMQSRYGSFFCTGNHDYYAGADAWCSALSRMGFTVLRNRRVRLGDAASIDLLGVDDPLGSVSGTNLEALTAAFKDRETERASVLMAHRPSDFAQALGFNVGLQLSGHTHGGQMFPGTWVSDLIWGNLSHGYAKSGSSQIYVSRGCGFVGPPMRVGSPPEVVQIVLTA